LKTYGLREVPTMITSPSWRERVPPRVSHPNGLAFDDRAAGARAIHEDVPGVIAVDLEVLATHIQRLGMLGEVEVVAGLGSGIAALADDSVGCSLHPARLAADPIRESGDLPLRSTEGNPGLRGEGHEQRAALRSGRSRHSSPPAMIWSAQESRPSMRGEERPGKPAGAQATCGTLTPGQYTVVVERIDQLTCLIV
jgi:hypothetical protein